MPAASWVGVADYCHGDETLELEQDMGANPKDALLRAIEESPEPASFVATHAADENDCETAKIHGQVSGLLRSKSQAFQVVPELLLTQESGYSPAACAVRRRC